MSFSTHATFKDSGVEWLGPIPGHWAVKRLRFVAEINPSKSEVAHLPADTEVSFLPMEAIGEDGSLELDRVRPLAEVQTGYTFFRDGDVAIAKITPCFENGKGAAMQGLCNGIGFGTTELIVARPKATQTTSAYLHWVFTSRPFRKAGEAFMYGAGGQRRVPDDFVRDFAIGFPPLPEQRHIVSFLDREAAKIDGRRATVPDRAAAREAPGGDLAGRYEGAESERADGGFGGGVAGAGAGALGSDPPERAH